MRYLSWTVTTWEGGSLTTVEYYRNRVNTDKAVVNSGVCSGGGVKVGGGRLWETVKETSWGKSHFSAYIDIKEQY